MYNHYRIFKDHIENMAIPSIKRIRCITPTHKVKGEYKMRNKSSFSNGVLVPFEDRVQNCSFPDNVEGVNIKE